MSHFGIDLSIFLWCVRALPWYLRDLWRFKKLDRAGEFPITNLFPCLLDKQALSGVAEGYYFHQDLLVAQMIFAANPERHVDVGSRVDGFVAHVAAFREIEVLDIRAQSSSVKNIKFQQADLMSSASVEPACTDSLSCLHALEHFGLGRYGDPIVPDGHLLALDNLYLMLKPGGTLYFSVPIGRQRIEFNAHRVFSLESLDEMFRGRFTVRSFSVVNDQGQLIRNAPWIASERASWSKLDYGCGIFVLERIDSPSEDRAGRRPVLASKNQPEHRV